MAETRGIHHAVTVYGTDTCTDTIRSRALLDALEVPYNYYNISLDASIARTAYALENGQEKIPVVKLGERIDDVLVEPSDEDLQAALHRTGHLR